MYQKHAIFKGFDDLSTGLSGIRDDIESHEYVDGFIDVTVAGMEKEETSKCLGLIKNEFPKLKIIGISSIGAIEFFTRDKDTPMEKAITLSFNLMARSHAKIYSREFDVSESEKMKRAKEYAVQVREDIKKLPNVSAIEVCFARVNIFTGAFVNVLSEGLEDVPIYGAIAHVNSRSNIRGLSTMKDDSSFVVADERMFTGVVVCAFYGEELYTYAEYQFGWEPVGRELELTTSDAVNGGTVTVNTIDGMPAVDVYKKYLGVEPNDYFVLNISEFPMIVERNGLYLGRTPSGYGPNGEVYLEGDILPGEKIRFSYGEYDDILNATRDGAARMSSFVPESLTLVICGNRFSFLQQDYRMEIEYYSDGRESEPSLILGMGEVYRYHGKGGILNSALVAVGMREGVGDESFSELQPIRQSHHHHGLIPLSERLSHFLKAMTDELVEAVEDADAANKAKSAFLSNMSHEIRTPINAVLGMDEMILRETDNEEILGYAQDIKNAGASLLGIINDILDFSKIEAGKMEIIPVDYDLSSVINDVVTMLRPRTEAKNLELNVDVDPTIPAVLNGDEIRIKQVITNIMTNAVKYTDEGSITLKVSHEKAGDGEIDLRIAVSDTGRGIREEDLGRMYDAFQRVDEVRNRNIEGTGLGLNITRQLLALMGSRLEVRSTFGYGTVFYFTIRQKVIRDIPIGDYLERYHKSLANRQVYHERFRAPDAQVLVVDDTPMNLTVFKNLLKNTQVQVDTASGGAECLEMTGKKKYDMIFLDHRMPEMDGIETLQKLKADKDNPNRDTFTVSLTANAISGAREQYMEAGFDDYLTKPIISDKLEAMMLHKLPEEKVERYTVTEESEDEKPDISQVPEWIRAVAQLEMNEGIANCGSVDSYIETVDSFADAAEDSYSDIRRFYEEKDIENFTTKVHALKSSARIIGAMDLSRFAEAMEKAGDARDITAIRANTPRLLEMLGEIKDELEKGRKTDKQDEDLPEIGLDKLKEAENAMKEVAGSFDYDSIQYIMETIKGFRVPESERKRIEELRKAVFNADWDGIRKTLGIDS